MVDRPDVRNEASGELAGTVVQAGSIHQVTVAGADLAERPLVPRQLPPAVRDFTGRAEHVAVLNALLPADGGDAVPTPSTAVITAIDGAAGIGKTTLAVWWAHNAAHKFPDGTLYANLRGYGPGEPATAAEVLDGFLRALGVVPERMPVGVEAQAGLFRSLLAKRRMLLVLDNANHPDQVRAVLPATPGCVVVITSRDSLTGLVVIDGARRLTLDLLTQHEAVQLVTGIVGPTRADLEATAVMDLVQRCARLPLALRIAAGRAAAYPHSTVAEVATELADEHARLDVLSRSGDERAAVRAVFDWSYRGLSVEQARVFRSLGLHPGADVSVHAAAAVAGTDPSTARRALDELAQIHLIEPVARGRYRFHDLLRAYALDQATRHDSPDDREHALQRLLDWYAHTSGTCFDLLYSVYDVLPLSVTAPAHPMLIADWTVALAWLTTERDNLLAAVHHAARHGLHLHTALLADRLGFFVLGLGSWDTAVGLNNRGLAAAQHSHDRSAETRFLIGRGVALMSLRRWEEAGVDFDQALTLARDADNRRLQAGALIERGRLCAENEHFTRALSCLGEALPLSRGVDTGRLESVVELNLSRACTGLGRYEQALRHAEIGLTLSRRCGALGGEAAALHYAARAWQGLGEHAKTIALCREAISLDRRLIDLNETVAEPLDTLAMSLHHTGDTTSAIACWEEAASIFNAHGRPFDADQARNRARRASEQA